MRKVEDDDQKQLQVEPICMTESERKIYVVKEVVKNYLKNDIGSNIRTKRFGFLYFFCHCFICLLKASGEDIENEFKNHYELTGDENNCCEYLAKLGVRNFRNSNQCQRPRFR